MAKPRLFVAGKNEHDVFGTMGEFLAEPTNAFTLLEPLPHGKYVAQVAFGCGATIMLDSGGELWAVGSLYDPADDDNTQLGVDFEAMDEEEYERWCEHTSLTLDQNLHRVSCSLGQRFTHIAITGTCCMAITDRGKLFSWGDGGETTGVLAEIHARFIATKTDCHTVILTSDGEVVVFGSNEEGELGTGIDYEEECEIAMTKAEIYLGYEDPTLLPRSFHAGTRIVTCAVGDAFTQLVSEEGRVFAMGRNTNGQLGIGTTDRALKPAEVECGEKIVAVACGDDHTLFLTAQGALHACGDSAYGATGLGYVGAVLAPQKVEGRLAAERIVRIAASVYHSYVLLVDGRVFTFGSDAIGAPAASGDGLPWKCSQCDYFFGPRRIYGPDETSCRHDHVRQSRHMVPHLLQGELADTAVCALVCCSYGETAAFIPGTPPALPGYDALLTPAWHRRRTLLMCLLRLECAPPGASDVLLRVAALSDEIWKGPLIFQYL